MIKNYCLIFLILFSQILLAQTDLARWNNTNLSATNYSPANIEVTNLKAVGVSNAVQGGFYYNGANHNIFSSSGWPNKQDVNLDPNKFIQFTISPKTGYKLNLSEFNFSCGTNGDGGTLKVDYSIYSDFSDPKTILEPTVITASMANFSLKNFISPLATDGQVVYVRVYFYNTYQVLNILFQDGNNVGPVFRGTVASSSTTPIATNDNVTTYINDDTKINVLANDDFSNTIDALVYTQPAHGITTLNPDNSIQYLPAKGYSGSDSFTYQIKNKFGDSNYAVVNINVVANTPSVLIRWDKNNYVASPQQLFLTATEMKVYGGVTRGIGSENTSVFIFGNIGNTNVDTAKYVEFVLDNTSTEKTVELQKFSFRGRGYNPGNYQVRHSKQQNFSSGVVTLPPGSYNASFNDQVVTFNANTKADQERRFISGFTFTTMPRVISSITERAIWVRR